MSGVPSSTIGWLRARRTAALLAIVAAVVGLTGFQLFRSHSPKLRPVSEATAAELVFHDGRLFRTNKAEPFTGDLVERYPSGNPKSRCSIKDGVLDGLSEGWYQNGQIEVRESFKAGISEGLRTQWYEQGAIKSEIMIRQGQHHGTSKRWHENGQLAETVQMKHGHPDGISLAYYPSGCLKARARTENGQIVEQKFWNDGGPPLTSAAMGTNSP